jgi:hypothetical protein
MRLPSDKTVRSIDCIGSRFSSSTGIAGFPVPADLPQYFRHHSASSGMAEAVRYQAVYVGGGSSWKISRLGRGFMSRPDQDLLSSPLGPSKTYLSPRSFTRRRSRTWSAFMCGACCGRSPTAAAGLPSATLCGWAQTVGRNACSCRKNCSARRSTGRSLPTTTGWRGITSSRRRPIATTPRRATASSSPSPTRGTAGRVRPDGSTLVSSDPGGKGMGRGVSPPKGRS